MSEIRKGDLCMVVRGHGCVVAARGGIPFTVESIEAPIFGGYRCPACKQNSIAPTELAAGWTNNDGQSCATPLSWLLKIDPPALSDAEPRVTELDRT